MSRGGGEWHVETDKVCLLQQGRQLDPGGAQFGLQGTIQTLPIMVQQTHAKSPSPAGDSLPNPAHTNEAKGLAIDVAAKQKHGLPDAPFVGSHIAVTLRNASRQAEE